MDFISISGKVGEKEFWFDASPKDYSNYGHGKGKRGKLIVAVNEYSNYFNVKLNHVVLEAGLHMTIGVKPTIHTYSQNFKALPKDTRKCLIPGIDVVRKRKRKSAKCKQFF